MQARQASCRNLSFVLLASFPAGPLQANCYFLASAAGADCAIVDPGMDSIESVERALSEYQLNPVAVLITHGHFDHMWQAAEVANRYGATVWIHPADAHLLERPLDAISNESESMLRAQFGFDRDVELTPPNVIGEAVDGAEIHIGSLTVRVHHVPGHTPGTVIYAVDYEGEEDYSQIMFTGDFVFAGAIGRTDLVGGSMHQMNDSLRWLLTQTDDTVLLPGHGPQSTLAMERRTNPFLLEVSS